MQKCKAFCFLLFIQLGGIAFDMLSDHLGYIADRHKCRIVVIADDLAQGRHLDTSYYAIKNDFFA